MQDVDLNWIAVVVATAIPMVVGALWYSPLLLGGRWMRTLGKTPEDLRGGARTAYLLATVASFVISYTVARIARWAEVEDLWSGALLGVLLWFGFVATTSAVNAIFSQRPRDLWAIEAGYFLVSLLLIGALHGVWE